ncbi:MAG: EamA family transporter [Lachnospiraceae bacterium]|nr:EamA family transporter [Lachnospiraceae bacterium]
MNRFYLMLMFVGTFFAAVSQILLKQSADRTYNRPFGDYLNWRVITSYGIYFGILFLNTGCYTKIDMKYGSIIDTCCYVFVMLLSCLILKEKITRRKLAGNLLIICGVMIYTMS